MLDYDGLQESDGACTTSSPLISWSKSDIERRFLFPAGRFTSVNRTLSLLLAAVLTGGFFSMLIYVVSDHGATREVAAVFLERGPTQYAAAFLFFWAAAILWLKGRKLEFQRRALDFSAVPQESDFVLNRKTAQIVLHKLHQISDHPRHFLLFNRIERALSNLKNIGQISEVSTILRDQAGIDEDQVHSSYGLVEGFVWGIPVLGFIGTVLGLSDAVRSFGGALTSAGDLNAIKIALQGVISGLATAFDTTLVALIGALIVQLWITFLRGRESSFLDECSEYCHAHVVARLRLAED